LNPRQIRHSSWRKLDILRGAISQKKEAVRYQVSAISQLKPESGPRIADSELGIAFPAGIAIIQVLARVYNSGIAMELSEIRQALGELSARVEQIRDCL
jgi:hypothetical protein